MARELRGSAVVLVGATSGIGRAAAAALADRGARLVLTARDAVAFGRVDTWVNTAAGLLAGELDRCRSTSSTASWPPTWGARC